MTKSLHTLEGIIWDLDDTLYAVTPDLHRSMRESVARAVTKMGYPISYDDALAVAEQSQEKHRMTVQMLMDRFNIQKRDLHLPFHAEMDHNVITPCALLPETFAALPHVKHTLITHASRDWGVRMLDHLGLMDFFDEKAIFGLEDIDYEHKHESDRATKTCLDAIGVDADKAAFAEDRAHNLNIPYDMGVTTVLIDHPSQPRDLPRHVDYRFDDANTFLGQIVDALSEQKKAV